MLVACSNSTHTAQPTPTADTATSTTASLAPNGSQPPAATLDCNRLDTTKLADTLGRAIALDPLTSAVRPVPPADQSMQCTFIPPNGGAQVGSVGFSSYPSAQVAKDKLNSGLADAHSFDLPVVEEHFGDAAFAVDQNGVWFCTILSDRFLASATAPGDDATNACTWAQQSLATFT